MQQYWKLPPGGKIEKKKKVCHVTNKKGQVDPEALEEKIQDETQGLQSHSWSSKKKFC